MKKIQKPLSGMLAMASVSALLSISSTPRLPPVANAPEKSSKSRSA